MQPAITNVLLALASLGCIGAALTHSYLGERLFIGQIQQQVSWPGGGRSAGFMQLIVRIAWHATSVMWAGFGAIFAAPLLGLNQLTVVYLIAAATFGIVFILTGPVTGWRHLGWPVFALITASLVGAALTAT